MTTSTEVSLKKLLSTGRKSKGMLKDEAAPTQVVKRNTVNDISMVSAVARNANVRHAITIK